MPFNYKQRKAGFMTGKQPIDNYIYVDINTKKYNCVKLHYTTMC